MKKSNHAAAVSSLSSRRSFLKTSAVAAAALALPRFSIGRSGPSPNDKINVACIGIGNRGFSVLSELMKDSRVNLVAFCDVDQVLVENTYARGAELRQNFALECAELPAVPLFRDYREMFARMAERIDAVTVCTPDHHHFPAAMWAVRHGKHVYVEKPLTHTVGEARALREAARSRGIVSQMGNQGRTTEGIRLMREWTQAGVLGDVREVHAWSPEFPERIFQRPASWPPPAQTPPPTLDWERWIGPAEMRPYHVSMAPLRWRGFWDFGSGMLGDWACHTLDGPFWALDLGAPVSVEASVDEVNDRITPRWAEVTYRFPARGDRPPVTMKWFEGNERKPPVPKNWEDLPTGPGLPERGMFMLGDKNTLFAPAGRPDSPRLLGTEAMNELKQNMPPKTIPRVKGGPVREWMNAIAGVGPMPGSNFEYAVPLTEMVLLGTVAVRTGKRIEWDAATGRITNDIALNNYVGISARDGWRV
jgi:Predicted dehydrogenases and related proteins